MNHLELLFFTKHLGIMLKAGIPLVEALKTLADQVSSSKQKQIIQSLVASVESGKTLSESLEAYPKIFSIIYQNLIQIGEKSGSLEECLGVLVIQQTKTYVLRKKIQSAMMYPMLVLGITFILGGAIAFFLLPKLADFFTSFSVELPATTKILLAFAIVMKNYGLLILVLSLVLIALLGVVSRLTPIKHRIDWMLLRIPIIGKIVRASELSLFTRNVATMLKRGIPIASALSLVARTQNNYQYESSLTQALAEVSNGKPFADSLIDGRLYPPLVTRMVSVGEKTGKLDEVLLYLADFMEEEVDEAAKNVSVLVEPILLFVIGLVVAFTALAIISPIYGLLNYIQ